MGSTTGRLGDLAREPTKVLSRWGGSWVGETPRGLGRVGSSHGHGGQSTPLARQLVPLPLAGASLDALGRNRWQEEREWASSLLQEVSGEELGGSLGGSLQGRVFFFFFLMGEN